MARKHDMLYQQLKVKRNTLICTLFGSGGFGVGGAVGGSLWLFDPENPMFPLTMAIMGTVGGASLGLALRSWKQGGLLTLAGGIGFLLGAWPTLFASAMVMTELTEHPEQTIFAVPGLLFSGGIQGAIGALTLWLVFKAKGGIGWLTAAGAAGFAIGSLVTLGMLVGLSGGLALAIRGIIGGAFLGAAIGYRQDMKQTLEQTIREHPK